MKSFWVKRLLRPAREMGIAWHRWVAAEPRRNQFDLWGYQDDTPEIVYLGADVHEEQLEKLACQFLWGDPEKTKVLFFHEDASNTLCRVEVQN